MSLSLLEAIGLHGLGNVSGIGNVLGYQLPQSWQQQIQQQLHYPIYRECPHKTPCEKCAEETAERVRASEERTRAYKERCSAWVEKIRGMTRLASQDKGEGE